MLFLFRPFFPMVFQGKGRRKPYFESWYFKHTLGLETAGIKRRRSLNIIAGILCPGYDEHAFIQIKDRPNGYTLHAKYPLSAFSSSDSPFKLRIGENHFSFEGIELNIKEGQTSFSGELRYRDIHHPHSFLFGPSIMGPYPFLYNMECRHHIASLVHSVEGLLLHNDPDGQELIDFTDATGYIEKSWGRSMPPTWIWVQTNIFEGIEQPISFVLVLTKLERQKRAFMAFFVILTIENREYRIASYSGGQITLMERRNSTLRLLFSDPLHKMEILIRVNQEGSLTDPLDGSMERTINESSEAWVRVLLKQRHGDSDEPVFDAVSTAASVQIVGDSDELIPE